MKRMQNVLWQGSAVGLLLGGWLWLAGPCWTQFGQQGQNQGGQGQRGQIQGGQNQGGQGQRGQNQGGQNQGGQGQRGQNQGGQIQRGQNQGGQFQGAQFQGAQLLGGQYQGGQYQGGQFQIRTLPSASGGYLGNFSGGFSTPSLFSNYYLSATMSPMYNTNLYNSSNYTFNPYNFNSYNFNPYNFNPYNFNSYTFNNTNLLRTAPVNAALFQQPWNVNPWMNFNNNNNMFMAANQPAMMNPFLQFQQNAQLGVGNMFGLNQGMAPFAGNFGGIGGMGAGQIPGLGGGLNQGGFAGFGGFGGGNPFVMQ